MTNRDRPGGRKRHLIFQWKAPRANYMMASRKAVFTRAGLRLSPERMIAGILSAPALEHTLPHPPSRAVERHQQSAVVRSQTRVHESRDFFLAQNRRKVNYVLRIESLGNAPSLLDSLKVEEPLPRRSDQHCGVEV
jgi:hypothetical protein